MTVKLLEHSDANCLKRVLSLVRKNYPFHFTRLCGFRPEEIDSFAEEWILELKGLFRYGKVSVLFCKIEEIDAYAILDLKQVEASTGEMQAAILDISLEESAWQSGAAESLLAKAEEIVREKKINYLVVHLPSGVGEDLKKRGFQPERHHVVKII